MSQKTTPEEKPAKLTLPAPSPALKYWIDLGKWFLVSIVIVVATKIIDTGFKDRERSLSELKEYGNYVTQLVVLNPNPVNKYELARYMVCITTSETMKKGWQAWFDSIYPEYVAYVERIETEILLLEERYASLRLSGEVKDHNQSELLQIEQQLAENRKKLFPSFVLPEERHRPISPPPFP